MPVEEGDATVLLDSEDYAYGIDTLLKDGSCSGIRKSFNSCEYNPPALHGLSKILMLDDLIRPTVNLIRSVTYRDAKYFVTHFS